MSQYLQATRGSPPDEWPHYDIGFVEAIKRGLRKYAIFRGRASRGEYWWWALFVIVGFFALGIMAALAGRITSQDGGITPGFGGVPLSILFVVFWLATIVPTVSVTVRRLHDAGYSGWLYLLNFLPVAGIVPFILTLLPASASGAKYGPPTPVQQPSVYPPPFPTYYPRR
jgi:uncharacterized membrane protein YhaH (DUF805 family)